MLGEWGKRYRGVVEVSAAEPGQQLSHVQHTLTYLVMSVDCKSAASWGPWGGACSRSTLIRHDNLSLFAIHRVTAARARSCLRREPSAVLDTCQHGLRHHHPSNPSKRRRKVIHMCMADASAWLLGIKNRHIPQLAATRGYGGITGGGLRHRNAGRVGAASVIPRTTDARGRRSCRGRTEGGRGWSSAGWGVRRGGGAAGGLVGGSLKVGVGVGVVLSDCARGQASSRRRREGRARSDAA